MEKNESAPNRGRRPAAINVSRALALAIALPAAVHLANAGALERVAPVLGSVVKIAPRAPEPVWEGTPSNQVKSSANLRFAAAADDQASSMNGRFWDHGSPDYLAQFQVPLTLPEIGAPTRPAVQFLTLQYAYGSESRIEYRRDRDLDRRIPDNSLIVAPQVNGIVLYRPTSWLEATLEMILEKEIPVNEKHSVMLPSGDIQRAPKRRASFVTDQAFLRVYNITAPFEFSVGRKNYEDDRHWLFDTSMDIISSGLRVGRLRADLTVGREVYKDLDFAPSKREPKDRVDTHMLYADYRLEDTRLAAYTIVRDDRARNDGRARLIGVRALGSPSDNLNYWTDVAVLRGTDESSRKFDGYGFDVGFTYRFTGMANHPNVTLSYAFGSGDGNPADQKNGEFRQSGLHSNETRLGGVSKFKVYGEALDPDLSNIKILTLGTGFRPAPTVSVDLVYHHYRLHRVSDQFRASALTAEINQIDDRSSKSLGDAVDVIVGFRRLFGLRLGLDLRAGVFFPGKAYDTNEGTSGRPIIRRGNKGYAFVGKIWW